MIEVLVIHNLHVLYMYLLFMLLTLYISMQPLVRQLGDDLCFCKDKDGNTPLHLAAQIGNMQAIENGILSPEIWDEDDDSDEEEEDSEDEVQRHEDMVSSTIYKSDP